MNADSYVSADSYPSRGNSVADEDLIRRSYASASLSEETPDRPTVQPEDLHYDRKNIPPDREVNGAMYSPQTTLKHGAAHEPGMPAGFTSAKAPE